MLGIIFNGNAIKNEYLFPQHNGERASSATVPMAVVSPEGGVRGWKHFWSAHEI